MNLEEVRLDAIQLHKESQKQKDEIDELNKQLKIQKQEMNVLKMQVEQLLNKK